MLTKGCEQQLEGDRPRSERPDATLADLREKRLTVQLLRGSDRGDVLSAQRRELPRCEIIGPHFPAAILEELWPVSGAAADTQSQPFDRQLRQPLDENRRNLRRFRQAFVQTIEKQLQRGVVVHPLLKLRVTEDRRAKCVGAVDHAQINRQCASAGFLYLVAAEFQHVGLSGPGLAEENQTRGDAAGGNGFDARHPAAMRNRINEKAVVAERRKHLE